ncbi:MAG: hypothetical protein IV106_02815 [Pseudomonas umsongensis]|nr:hypothetical protein [Pseudomonas umsongensis]
MTDRAELIELCKIAQHLGGPQNLSAVGIGRYLRLCSPEVVLAMTDDIERLQAENATLRSVMEAVVSEIPFAENIKPGNAPGHSHNKPGIWDEDNGAKAGKDCAWCKVWNFAISISKES